MERDLNTAARVTNSAKLASYSGFDKQIMREHRIARVVFVSSWAKFVGLCLVVVMLLIVIAPYFDLPPTAVRSSSATHRVPHSPLNAAIAASITLLKQPRLSPSVQAIFAGFGDLSTSLIDLNCTRLC